MEFIKNAKWRYATKSFDTNRKLSIESIELLKKSIQLSPSSYGLQPYKVLIIEDVELRQKLKPISWNQNQIIDASHLFIFCNYIEIKSENIDDFIDEVIRVQSIDIEDISGYRDFIKMKIAEKKPEEQFNWSKNQTYIALSNLMNACSELKIDTCPMEGFDKDKYNELLDLTEKGLNASVIASVGYRANNDETQFKQKVRKPINELFIKY